MPKDLRTVEELLWQQYAVREQDKPQEPRLHWRARTRGADASVKAFKRFCSSAARAWRFLQRLVRRDVAPTSTRTLDTTNFRLHAQTERLDDRARYRAPEPGWGLGEMERRWGEYERKYGSEERRGRGNHLSRAAWKDPELHDMRPVLEHSPRYTVHGPLINKE